MKGALHILRFLEAARDRGERTALLTIADVIGSAARSRGTHMAVSETGSSLGSVSGGCVEAALVAEAQRVIATGRAELVRFGIGSRFLDIRLPCGGGLDILVTPAPDRAALTAAIAALDQRRDVVLRLGLDGSVDIARSGALPRLVDGVISVHHRPDLRVIMAGHGAETLALTRLSLSYGAQALVLSPDADHVAIARGLGAEAWRLTAGRSPHLRVDPHCAVVMLFHEHDREVDLLLQALEQAPFYIGAMGSRATHARRLDALAARGSPDARLRTIRGPIGLIPATRNPDTLALSVLGEIVASYEASGASDPT